MSKLNDKQKRFCEEYLIDLNATQAAIRAGYSVKTARGAAKWIQEVNPQKPILKMHIEVLKQSRSHRTGITADSVLEELYRIASADVEITERSKMKALELIGKHLGMFSAGSDNSAALEKLDEVLGSIKGGF